MEVSTSAYYDWSRRDVAGPSAAELEEAFLVEQVRALHAGSDSTYGSPG